MTSFWDRLLETCCARNATDILLSPGSPPLLRLADKWHTLQVPAVDVTAIQTLVSEQLAAKPDGEVDGYAYWDFQFRRVFCLPPGTLAAPICRRFRATAFGYPATNVLLISPHPENSLGGGAQPQEAGV